MNGHITKNRCKGIWKTMNNMMSIANHVEDLIYPTFDSPVVYEDW